MASQSPASESAIAHHPAQSQAWTARFVRGVKSTVNSVVFHATKHTGVGIICSVAYFDPGNWGVDLQAGSQYGYKLLFIVLVSGIFAVFLQILASRLGVVTGLDLASHCRVLLHSRQKHTLLYRWLLLYPLYALSEIAIIATDLAELLGSGIALVLLFPWLPLWAGVLITALDVFILLALRDPLGGRPVRLFEIIIAILVFTVLMCMAVIIAKITVHWGPAFDGFVPSRIVFTGGGLYTSIGVIGATVMPHSIFLGSALATQNRTASDPDSGEEISGEGFLASYWRGLKERVLTAFKVNKLDKAALPKSHAELENREYAFVRSHIYHGMIDMAISLIGIAVVINALILILASAVFYYGATGPTSGPADLFDAYDLLKSILGKGVATVFALALLASGQSSSIIATMAGQTVSEGFLRWRVSPVMRRVITRALGLVPSMAVAIAVGRSGVDTLLVASQVALSIVLPFIVFPLLYLTNSRSIMTVKKIVHRSDVSIRSKGELSDSPSKGEGEDGIIEDLEASEEFVDYSNGKFVIGMGWLLWIIIVAANAYAIITLILGED